MSSTISPHVEAMREAFSAAERALDGLTVSKDRPAVIAQTRALIGLGHALAAVAAAIGAGVSQDAREGQIRPDVPLAYTAPEVFTRGVEEGWADPETDPTQIDWPARQAAAAVPFLVVAGRPVSPCPGSTVRYGRNQLGHWGEQKCADALVTSTDEHGYRWLLMVERGDGLGWALPGGYVEAGEAPVHAALRELAEETGLQVPQDVHPEALPPRFVPDPRGSDEAWMVTTPVLVDLGERRPLVHGQDDARRAEWIRADSSMALRTDLAGRFGGRVFVAHRDLLRERLR